MSKLGIITKSRRRRISKAKLTTPTPRVVKVTTTPTNPREVTATMNRAGGGSFDLTNPSEKLLVMCGGMFNEPEAYPAIYKLWQSGVYRKTGLHEPDKRFRTTRLKMAELEEIRVKEMTQTAIDLISTAFDVSLSNNARDLLSIANYSRNVLNMRTTPQMLLVIAANNHPDNQAKQYVRDYCPKIISRADELKTVFAAWMYLFGKPIPNCLKRGLADAMSKFKEQDFLKYEGQTFPRFKDILTLIDRGRDYPLPKALATYLKTGEIDQSLDVLQARAKYNKCPIDEVTGELMREAKVTWEVHLSKTGRSKESWEAIIPMMPRMATLRNLRNFVECDVSEKHIEKVVEKITSVPEYDRILPFRYQTAFAILDGMRDEFRGLSYRRTNVVVTRQLKAIDRLMDAIAKAMTVIAGRLRKIPGTTVIALDNSGSMDTPLSQNSAVSVADTANTLGAIITEIAEDCIVVPFGERAIAVNVDRTLSIPERAYQIEEAEVGRGATNAHKVIELLLYAARKRNSERFITGVDRIIMLSDAQTWNPSGGRNDDVYRGVYCVNEALVEYNRLRAERNVAPVFFHSIDLQGYGGVMVNPAGQSRISLLSGFSERILDFIAYLEGRGDGSMAIDVVRRKF